jgi:DNA-binding MarR family transcriptional regulator
MADMKKRLEKKPTPCYCLKMRRLTLSLSKFYDAALAAIGIPLCQYAALAHISRVQCCSVTELADLTELDRSTLTRNLRPLFKRGLVIDSKEPGTRNSRLEVTQLGKEKMVRAKQLWDEVQDDIKNALGPEGQMAVDTVVNLLGSL